jgi:hypothetical protein
MEKEGLEPYKDLVRSIVVQQLTQSGWVDLISIPIANPEKLTPEQIQKAIESAHQFFYKADKIELSVQGVQLCVRGVDQGGTFRVCASYKNTEGLLVA